MGKLRVKRGSPSTGGDGAGGSVGWSVNEMVWALDRENGRWRRGVIIATERPAELSGSSVSENEAYIHWKGYDRRLDCWLPYSDLRRYVMPPPTPSRERGLGDDAGSSTMEGYDVELDEIESDDGHHGTVDKDYLREHQEHTKFKTINTVQMGKHVVSCWYFSPYPLEVQNTGRLYVCEFCLSFFKHEIEMDRHSQRCAMRHPPGHEIYRDDNIAVWEVDGGMCRVYCENLSYLSKLFLDHKTLKHPVHLFLFYVITEIKRPPGDASDETGVFYQIVGYFSKEKYSRNNLSCILVLPQHQKKGYGKYLINFSYALALKEGRRGTPERPLSDLGRVSYINYWTQCLLYALKDRTSLVIDDLADQLSFEPTDIITTFDEHNLLQRDPITHKPFLYLPDEYVQLLASTLGRPSKPVQPHKLRWIPYDPFLGPFEYIAE